MSEVAKISQHLGKTAEAVLIEGDLSKLTEEQRVIHYKNVCESLGLNYLTKPFAYIRLNGKLTFYALKDCTEQLRKRDGVSIIKLETQSLDGVFVVTAYAQSASGKLDVATGAVPTNGLKGEALANALMKAETKAKRRVTLSICGLGMTDEEEISSIPMAQKVDVNLETGEIVYSAAAIESLPIQTTAEPINMRTDEEILTAITAEMGSELANEISSAKDIDALKAANARAYALHENREHLMQKFIELKDLRKKQLMSFGEAMEKALFDDACPDLTGAPA